MKDKLENSTTNNKKTVCNKIKRSIERVITPHSQNMTNPNFDEFFDAWNCNDTEFSDFYHNESLTVIVLKHRESEIDQIYHFKNGGVVDIYMFDKKRERILYRLGRNKHTIQFTELGVEEFIDSFYKTKSSSNSQYINNGDQFEYIAKEIGSVITQERRNL